MQRLANNYVDICYYEKSENTSRPYIIVRDLKDEYNGTTSYTTLIRGLDMAWKFIDHLFTVYELKQDLNFSDINKVLDNNFNLKTRMYCSVD
jgi:hypothetical protein